MDKNKPEEEKMTDWSCRVRSVQKLTDVCAVEIACCNEEMPAWAEEMPSSAASTPRFALAIKNSSPVACAAANSLFAAASLVSAAASLVSSLISAAANSLFAAANSLFAAASFVSAGASFVSAAAIAVEDEDILCRKRAPRLLHHGIFCDDVHQWRDLQVHPRICSQCSFQGAVVVLETSSDSLQSQLL
jgi:hypothetical protein